MRFGLALMFSVLLFESRAYGTQFYRAWVTVIDGKHIPDLKWENEFIRIRSEKSGLGEQSSVFIAGSYYRYGWKLFSAGKEVTLNDRGGFRLEVPIDNDGDQYVFEARGPNGEIQKEVIKITSSRPKDGDDLTLGKVFSPSKKRFFLSAGAGISSLSTSQTEVQDYSTFALTAKISANYRLIQKVLDLGVSSYMTVAQLSRSYDVSARYFGFNFRLGYLIPSPSTEWFFSIYGGWYYTTMVVDPPVFGYRNLSGPQVYPAARKVLKNGNVLSGYLKYSPVASSFSLLKLSNREIAGGVSYLIMLEDEQSIGFTFDVSNIKLTIDGLVTQTNSLTLGAQYGF